MTRPRIKHLRERLALWVAPWLLKPYPHKFGGPVHGALVVNNTFTTRAGVTSARPPDPHDWSRRVAHECRVQDLADGLEAK